MIPRGSNLTQDHKDRISRAYTGKKLSQQHKDNVSKGLRIHFTERTAERRSQALREYYQEHQVWNKGLNWPQEIRGRIREGCLNSAIGMGPKFKEEEEQQEVLV
jgi:hypothetical protein